MSQARAADKKGGSKLLGKGFKPRDLLHGGQARHRESQCDGNIRPLTIRHLSLYQLATDELACFVNYKSGPAQPGTPYRVQRMVRHLQGERAVLSHCVCSMRKACIMTLSLHTITPVTGSERLRPLLEACHA
ncbi:MAG: hypothetical protein JW910_01190 [Anaerolineae bacterium]|nr:hypothetical protein [Anaerolineae bacterium]